MIGAPKAPAQAKLGGPPTLADAVTLAGYGLGLWWALGGPMWAGLASIAADELDGRLARHMGTESERGSALDWGADVALTPAVLNRLGKATGHQVPALCAAPLILFTQAHLRARGYAPPIGSARAAIMLITMAHERGMLTSYVSKMKGAFP